MNIRRAGRKVVKNLHKGYGIYRIGFVNIYGEEDETELDAMNINDLERLWLSLCPEFECKANSLTWRSSRIMKVHHLRGHVTIVV